MGRSHPARQARVVVGAAGSAGFLVMVGTISQASTQILAADLSAALEIPETPSGLDLQGNAVPGPATEAEAAEVMSETGDVTGSSVATAETPATSVAPEEAPTSSAAAEETGTQTTVADAAAEPEEQATTTVTTAPPATTTTTAPPQTDTTSSGS